MTESRDLAFQYDIADGPDQLREVLDAYYVKSQNDPVFAKVGHYILYQLGDQRSLIRVDTSDIPFHFRYCDLMGRPATKAVKRAIAQFLWEKCGEKERYTRELKERELI